jgi:hypothetical protein
MAKNVKDKFNTKKINDVLNKKGKDLLGEAFEGIGGIVPIGSIGAVTNHSSKRSPMFEKAAKEAKKIKETPLKKKATNKKSSVAQLKLYDLLPEDEQAKMDTIMDDIDITDERVMSKFSPMIKEWEASVKGFTGISEFLKFSDKKLHGKMSKVAETIEEINSHLEGIIGKISSKK